MNNKIDFVLIWVDDSDVEWQKEKNKYLGISDEELDGAIRYRDWDLLKYWFRGVEKFAPWVNNVFFITCGHYPKWLNLSNPKLKFVKHDEYIDKKYLPLYNSSAIEVNFNKIKDLSEQFVYFNDDMFLTSNVSETDFFKNGKPVYNFKHEVFIPGEDTLKYQHKLLNNMFIINKYFDKSDSVKKNFSKWISFKYDFKYNLKNILLLPYKKFSVFADSHMPSPILKSTMDELWDIEGSILNKTTSDRFRNLEDVNQYLFKFYDIARGNFEPGNRKESKYYDAIEYKTDLLKNIQNQKYKLICINDTTSNIDFEEAKEKIQEAFENILPDKSNFEI